jgi:hypothetical protein
MIRRDPTRIELKLDDIQVTEFADPHFGRIFFGKT